MSNANTTPIECPTCHVDMQFVDITKRMVDGEEVEHDTWQCCGFCTEEDGSPTQHHYRQSVFKLMPDSLVGGGERYQSQGA